MNILVTGGTRFFGIPMVETLLKDGHEVTIATRGRSGDPFGSRVRRIVLERTSADSVRKALCGRYYDVVIDKIGYCSNDVKILMDAVSCGQYIHMSSTAVYQPLRPDTRESDFDGTAGHLVWCDRMDFPYAEYALWQHYPDRNWTAVRYPFVIGKDDYTKRLLFYVEHVMKSMPMYIDNPDCQMGFIRSDEAGRFLAFLAGKNVPGAFNGCSGGTVSIREMLDYVEMHKVDCSPKKVFDLSEMAKAHEYLGSSHSFGKVVVMSEKNARITRLAFLVDARSASSGEK